MIDTMTEPSTASTTGAPLLTLMQLRQIERAASRGLGATASETLAMLAAIQALRLWQPDDEQTELAERPAHIVEDHMLDAIAELIEAEVIDPAVFGPMLAEIRYYRSVVAHDGSQPKEPTLSQAQQRALAQAGRDAQRVAALERDVERLTAELAQERGDRSIQLDLLDQIVDAFTLELAGEANPAAIPDYVADVYKRLRKIKSLATISTDEAAALRFRKIAKLADVSEG